MASTYWNYSDHGVARARDEEGGWEDTHTYHTFFPHTHTRTHTHTHTQTHVNAHTHTYLECLLSYLEELRTFHVDVGHAASLFILFVSLYSGYLYYLAICFIWSFILFELFVLGGLFG
jgi:hypothetical protein